MFTFELKRTIPTLTFLHFNYPLGE